MFSVTLFLTIACETFHNEIRTIYEFSRTEIFSRKVKSGESNEKSKGNADVNASETFWNDVIKMHCEGYAHANRKWLAYLNVHLTKHVDHL